MDPELTLAVSSILLELNELSPREGSSLTKQTISVICTNQGGGSAEQTQTKTKSAGNQLTQEDSLLSLNTRLSEMEEIIDEGPIPGPESSMSPSLSFENEMTPEDPVTLLMLAVPCEAKLEPVIPLGVHGLKGVMPFKDPSIFSSQPKESDLTPVDTPEFAYTSHLSFHDRPENSLTPDQLLSFKVPPVHGDKNYYGHLETPHPIPEYPAERHRQSELLAGLKQNDLAPASQAVQPQNITLPSCETTEETAMLVKNGKRLEGQNVFFQMQSRLHEMEPKSVKIPQLHSVSNLSLLKIQELAKFRDFPVCQHQACCSAPNPHLQPFCLPSLLVYGPQTPTTSNPLSTGPHLHAFQTPNMTYRNYVHPNTFHLLPMPTVYANLKQSGHQLICSCQKPGLQPGNILQNPFTPDKRFKMTNITFDNCPHLKPNLHEIPQKQYENFRLWQEYCKVARTVYTSSPDLEALACFFL